MAAPWHAVEEIFRQALERPEAQRQAFLDERCSGDDALRREVESLLAADAAAGDFIEHAVAGGGQLLSRSGDPLEDRRTAGKNELLGKYQILEPIGEGGFGAVYKGRDTVLQRFVAIKVCTSRNAGLRRRFIREAEIAAGLQHPNITTLHDLGTEDGIPFLVQEFLDGEDLEQLIRRRQELPLATRLDILAQVARGLEYAHHHGVLHRDVKPANVRWLPNGRAKIMDFGIARLLDDDTGLTQDGESLGTAGYLAPELLRSEALDPRADLFAFGVLAYELLTYERPFPGDSFSQISYRVLYEEPAPLGKHWPQCPPALNELVLCCLEKDRELRYTNASELLQELETLIEETANGAAISAIPQDPPASRRPMRLAIAGLAIAALAALLALQNRLPKPAEAPTASAFPEEGVEGTWLDPSSQDSPGQDDPELDVAEQTNPQKTSPEVASNAPAALLSQEPAEEASREALGPPGDRAPRRTVVAGSPPTDPAPLSASRSLETTTSIDDDASPAKDPSLAAPATNLAPPPPEITLAPEAGIPETGIPEAGPSTIGTPQEIPAKEDAVPLPQEPSQEGSLAAAWPLLREGPGVSAPQILQRPAPAYPEAARRRRREATVVIAVLVDGDGNVEHALVKQQDASGLGFNEAALAAARRAIFRPAVLRSNGTAGKMWTEISFEFQLE